MTYIDQININLLRRSKLKYGLFLVLRSALASVTQGYGELSLEIRYQHP